MKYFIQTEIACPCGHEYDKRRQYTSAGFIVATRCPSCRKQHDVRVPNAKMPKAEMPKATTHTMLERDIEKQLVKRVKELGGEVRKVKWLGRNSAPDRIVMLPSLQEQGVTRIYSPENWKSVTEGKAIWIELKAPGRAATFPKTAHEKAQHREHERMRKMGQRVEVVDSYEKIEEILK